MGIFDRLFNNNIQVERDKGGNWSYFGKGSAFGSNHDFLEWSLCNPVLFSVIMTRAKLFSQMKITATNEKGDIVDVPELELLNNPNYFQSKQDFLKQFMWYLSVMGENFIYKIQPLTTQEPKALYNLIPTQTDFKDIQKLNQFIFSKGDIKKFGEKTIDYKLDNKTYCLKITDIIGFYDIANGLQTDSLLNSPSRISAVSNTLQNIDENIKSKNVNLKFSQKFLATNKNDETGATQLDDDDRISIENVIGSKSLNITNAEVKFTHLVTDLKRLYLDEQLAADANTVAIAFEMNNDIVNYFLGKSSTFENQEESAIRYIQNSIQSDGDNFANSMTSSFGLNERGIKLNASYDHLPVMQTVMETKLNTFKLGQETIKLGLENGTITQAEAVEMTNSLKNKLSL